MTTPLLYIVSAPYSGSTLLAFLLATHPEIATIGERGHFCRKVMASPVAGSPYCSCGRLFSECEFWTTIRTAVTRQLDPGTQRLPFSTFQLINRPRRLRQYLDKMALEYALQNRPLPFPLRGRFQALQKANTTLIQAVLETGRARVFLDSSKVVEHAVFLGRTPGFQLYTIHLLRDGRAQVHSTVQHHPERNVTTAGRQWARQVQQQMAVLQRANLPCLTVRYEELCADPQGTTAAILNFAGLDPTPASLQFRQVEQHIMGNPMRLNSSEEIVDKQAWHGGLTAGQLAQFEEAAGAFNRSLGYQE